MTLLSHLCMYNVLASVGVDSTQMKCKFRVISSSDLAVTASSSEYVGLRFIFFTFQRPYFVTLGSRTK